MGVPDELLVGAIDMHCHGFPEFDLNVPHRYRDEDHVEIMRQSGMAGVVLKSHFWPTIKTADLLNARMDDFRVYSSVTLNPCAGGLEIWAVDAALRQGAKVVYLPTWSARNDMQRNTMIKTARKYLPTLEQFTIEESIAITDDNGKLVKNMQDILQMAHERDAVMYTCHISPEESLALARAARDIGYGKLVFTHPDSGSVGATFEQICEMADLGAYIEICALGLMPLFQRVTPQTFADIIRAVGADKCILTSDFFYEWAPPVPEQLRILITSLLAVGITPDEVRRMTRYNPEKLLNLA